MSRVSYSICGLSVSSDVCWRMLTYADVYWVSYSISGLSVSSDVCWRMLTYADVCWRMQSKLLYKWPLCVFILLSLHTTVYVSSYICGICVSYADPTEDTTIKLDGKEILVPQVQHRASIYRCMTYAYRYIDICWNTDVEPRSSVHQCLSSTWHVLCALHVYTWRDSSKTGDSRAKLYHFSFRQIYVCWRMLTYADVCWRMVTGQSSGDWSFVEFQPERVPRVQRVSKSHTLCPSFQILKILKRLLRGGQDDKLSGGAVVGEKRWFQFVKEVGSEVLIWNNWLIRGQ